MTSLGIWRFPFFSMTQSSIIQWNRASWLAHLTATLVLQSLHVLRHNIPTLLPVLFSFTSTGLRALIWYSPNINPPIIVGLPSIFPTMVNYFTDLVPTTLPSSRPLQICHLIVIWVLSKSLFLCANFLLSNLWTNINYSSYHPSKNLQMTKLGSQIIH